MTEEEIIQGNKLIAEFMGFKRYYPNMTGESELSKHYYYPKMDRIFDESMYITDMSKTCAEGVYKCIDITQSRHIKEYRFHSSWNWLIPVYSKLMQTISPVDLEEIYDMQNSFEEAVWHDRVDWGFGAVVEFLNFYNQKIEMC